MESLVGRTYSQSPFLSEDPFLLMSCQLLQLMEDTHHTPMGTWATRYTPTGTRAARGIPIGPWVTPHTRILTTHPQHVRSIRSLHVQPDGCQQVRNVPGTLPGVASG